MHDMVPACRVSEAGLVRKHAFARDVVDSRRFSLAATAGCSQLRCPLRTPTRFCVRSARMERCSSHNGCRQIAAHVTSETHPARCSSTLTRRPRLLPSDAALSPQSLKMSSRVCTLAAPAASQVVLLCVVGTGLVAEAADRHKCSPTATAAVGRALLGTLLLGAFEKDEATTQVTFRGNGPLGQSAQQRLPHLLLSVPSSCSFDSLPSARSPQSDSSIPGLTRSTLAAVLHPQCAPWQIQAAK